MDYNNDCGKEEHYKYTRLYHYYDNFGYSQFQTCTVDTSEVFHVYDDCFVVFRGDVRVFLYFSFFHYILLGYIDNYKK